MTFQQTSTGVVGSLAFQLSKLEPPPLTSITHLTAAVAMKGRSALNVLGVSGAGKTRLANEFAVLQPTIVLIGNGSHVETASQTNSTGTDIAKAMVEINRRQALARSIMFNKLDTNPDDVDTIFELRTTERRIAQHVFECLVASRIGIYKKLRTLAPNEAPMTPRDWLVGQLYPSLIEQTLFPVQPDIFWRLTSYLLENLRMTGVDGYIAELGPTFRAVIDEAQIFMSVGRYHSVRSLDLRRANGLPPESKGGYQRVSAYDPIRSLFSVVLEVVGPLSPLVSGTGVTMTEFEHESGNHVAKVGGTPSHVRPAALSSAEVVSYVGKFLELNDIEKSRLGLLLRGRARFAATLVMVVLASEKGDVISELKTFQIAMTRDPSLFPEWFPSKSSLVPIMEAIERGEKGRVIKSSTITSMKLTHSSSSNSSASNTNGRSADTDVRIQIRETFRKLVLANLISGGKKQVSSDDNALALIERGVCFLEVVPGRSLKCAALYEPLVVQAAANAIGLLAVAESNMASVAQIPSALGFAWEQALSVIIHDHFHEQGDGKLRNFLDYPFVDPMRDALAKDTRFEGDCSIPNYEYFGLSGNKLGDLVQWLEECYAAIKQLMPLPTWVFFPEEAAGPDLVFWLQIGNKFHVVFLQAKLKKFVGAHDAYRTVIPESSYVQKTEKKAEENNDTQKFELPDKHEGLNSRLVAAVRDAATVSSVVRMIVAYPSAITKLSTAFPAPVCEGVGMCQPDARQVKDLLIVIRGGQGDGNNSRSFFTDSHLEFLSALKDAT